MIHAAGPGPPVISGGRVTYSESAAASGWLSSASSARSAGMTKATMVVSTVATRTATKTAPAASMTAWGWVGPPGPVQDRVGDRPEDGHAHGAADRAGEHVGSGHDPALGPPDARLRRDEARRGDEAEAETHDEAGDGDDRHLRALGPHDEDQHADEHEAHPDEDRGPEPVAHVEQPAGEGRGERPTQGERGEGEARHQRRGADRPLEVGRDVRGQPDEDGPDAQRDEAGRQEQPSAQDPQGEDRLGRPPFHEHEGDEEHGAGGEHGDARGRGPGPGLAALQDTEDEQGHRAHQQDRARVVDAVPATLDAFVEVPPDQHAGEEAERHVDEEDPAPEVQLGEEAAERRSDDRGRAPDAGDVALDPGPLRDGVDVAGDGDRHRLDRAGAEALQGTEGDERRHAPRQAAQDGTQQKDPDAEQHERLSADRVGELRVDRDRHGLGEQVDREQPGERGEPAELADDRRNRRRQHRGVDGDEPRRHHEGEQDRTAFRPEPDGGVGGAGRRGRRGRHNVAKSSSPATIPGSRPDSREHFRQTTWEKP